MYAFGYNSEELSPAVKAHLWKSVGVPSLSYAIGTCPLSKADINQLESFQGSMIKSALYLNKRAHHSALLEAMNICKISDIIARQRISLLRRIFSVKSPYSTLCSHLISRYICTGVVPHNTLVGSIIELGLSPVRVAFFNDKIVLPRATAADTAGIVDSIKFTLETDNLKPGNRAHNMLVNLTKSF